MKVFGLLVLTTTMLGKLGLPQLSSLRPKCEFPDPASVEFLPGRASESEIG